MFFEPRNRILISGDALWENGMGFVHPVEGPRNPYAEAAREALAAIERLDPAVVIPGHGAPFADAAGSIAHVRSRLDAFERDPVKAARHMARVMFVFSLLDRQAMRVEDVPGYVASVECHARIANAFLDLEPRAYAEWLLSDLDRAGAIDIRDGVVRATARA
jgi:glyoxylase-like metal-dependent hydrolase (beta-lactamase superfamily II)